MKEEKKRRPIWGSGWVSISFCSKVWALLATVTLCPDVLAAIINNIPKTNNNPAPFRKTKGKQIKQGSMCLKIKSLRSNI